MGTKVERSTFKIGDKVWWESQAGGFSTRKQGTVVRVIPPHETCHLTNDELKLSCQVDSPYGRDHENYLVVVPSKSGKGKGKIYRPVVSKLHRV